MVKELGLIHFAPVEFEKHFKALVKLGDKNIEFLSKSVNKAGHFGIENKSDAKSLLSKLKIDLDQISDIVSVSIYLHDKVCDDEISLNHLLDELKIG